MGSYHRSRALAVEVEIAYVELAHGAIELLARTGIDRAGQAKLGVIGDLQGVIEVARFDHHQHRPKDFFLLELRLRRNVSNYGGLNEITFSSFRVARAAGDQASIFFADLDIAQDVVHRTFIDDGSHVGVGHGIADGDAFDAGLQLFEEPVVDALVDNGTRTG